MRVAKLIRTDTDQERYCALATLEALGELLQRVPNGVQLIVELEDVDENDYHAIAAGPLWA